MKFLSAFVLILMVLASPQSAMASPHLKLFDLIDQRLELMRDVATDKWRNKAPVEDLQREALVLDRVSESALNVGIETASARSFFQIQMEAAKEIQLYWFDRFEAGESPSLARNLDETRSLLLALGEEIIAGIDTAGRTEAIWRDHFIEQVQVEGLSPATVHALFRALTEVQQYPDRLSQVLSTGRLRVGTTGDYAPFTLTTADGFAGIDIDLANDLAKALGVEVSFVETSWSNLMNDLGAGRFDIGVGGISRTTERQKTAYFSPPYYTGGKTPIIRCADANRFNSLTDIDQEGVRVIVNPGGTNAAFAHANITRALLTIHDDNRTIFEEIAAGRADVMITDAIEVRLKTRQYPVLCPAMPGKTLTFLEKAFLLPQDIKLKEFVGAWLEQRIADGTVAGVFSAHMDVTRPE